MGLSISPLLLCTLPVTAYAGESSTLLPCAAPWAQHWLPLCLQSTSGCTVAQRVEGMQSLLLPEVIYPPATHIIVILPNIIIDRLCSCSLSMRHHRTPSVRSGLTLILSAESHLLSIPPHTCAALVAAVASPGSILTSPLGFACAVATLATALGPGSNNSAQFCRHRFLRGRRGQVGACHRRSSSRHQNSRELTEPSCRAPFVVVHALKEGLSLMQPQ